VAYVPEDRSLFADLTVKENLRLAPGLSRKDRAAGYDRAVDMFAPLAPLMSRPAGLLSGGEQQMLAMARALVSSPKVLLVDEMSLGLAPVIVEEMLPVVGEVARRDQVAVLLVEQHVHLALELADTALVMRQGELAYAGPAERDTVDELLTASYLS
jgi:branched-chain amino acid transport system ATP-binding protein